MSRVTIWTVAINCGQGNNPPMKMELAGDAEPTFEQIKSIWDARSPRSPLGRTIRDQYYWIGRIESRSIRRTEAESHNATFHCFKPRGKWYTSARGVLPASVFDPYYQGGADARPKIHAANDGKMPGLSGPGDWLIVVVVPDDAVDFGFPILMHPERVD